ncbi:ribosomal protein S12 methylthiotransferase accessory factor [Pseudoduganella flava]|uniref:Cyclodehydratase n=1 Tax=Pseudoduganella flava TaxID=871742 RepID=A0A562PN08_9BURK|nr:YcaO-like family protein [Pseudoduganella flava]QGZ40732.1 cyclodehydratase [Pseudoduganella flava]TWI45807.1 ribosomal protein S12 methylthiotransferase accessory factor [Pseudoduganella flava]
MMTQPTHAPAGGRAGNVFIFSAHDGVRSRLADAAGGQGAAVHAWSDADDRAAFAQMHGAAARGVGIVAVERYLLFFPVGGGVQACARCLRQARLAQKIPHELAAHRRGSQIDECAPAHLSPFALDLVPALMAFVIERADSGIALDLVALTTVPFGLHGQRSCELCNPPPAADTQAAPRLEHRYKRHAGAYRCRQLGDFAIDVGRYIHPVNGMLGKQLLQNRELPFYALSNGRFFESELAREAPIDWFGTAQTYRDSAVVGIIEGLERHAGLLARDRAPAVRASYAQIAGETLHPASLGLYEDHIYDSDPSLRRFTPETEFTWVRGHSIARGGPVLVPSDFVYYGGRQMIYGNSSGCATGSCVEEALLFGLLETIERDAFMLHWLARLAPRHIALDTVEDLECRTIIARLTAAGAQLHLLDARLDLPIPVVLAVIVREPGQYGTFSIAAGASFDPGEAIRRALGEVAVHFHGFEERSRRAAAERWGDGGPDFASVTGLEDHALLYGQPQVLHHALFLVENGEERSFGDTYAAWNAVRPRSLSLLDDLEFFFAALREAGHGDVVWVDQSSPEQMRVGLRTVRAIVPGMLPIDFGHGRCRAATLPRLYELPQRLGLRADRLQPADLHRAPHPFP